MIRPAHVKLLGGALITAPSSRFRDFFQRVNKRRATSRLARMTVHREKPCVKGLTQRSPGTRYPACLYYWLRRGIFILIRDLARRLIQTRPRLYAPGTAGRSSGPAAVQSVLSSRSARRSRREFCTDSVASSPTRRLRNVNARLRLNKRLHTYCER